MSEGIPCLGDDIDYRTWKRQVRIWQLGTSAKPEQQAARLIGKMAGKCHEAAIQLDLTKLADKDEGVNYLLKELDKDFLSDQTQTIFSAMDEFVTFKRTDGQSVEDYIREFSQRHKKLTTIRGKGDLYEDGILGCMLMKQANLSENEELLIRASTPADVSFAAMEALLKRTFGKGGDSKLSRPNPMYEAGSSSKIKSEPVYFTSNQLHRTRRFSTGSLDQIEESDDRTIGQQIADEENEDTEVFYFHGEPYWKAQKRNSRVQRPTPNVYQKRSSSFQPYQNGRGRGSSSFGSRSGQEIRRCFKCNEEGHFKKDCPQNGHLSGSNQYSASGAQV